MYMYTCTHVPSLELQLNIWMQGLQITVKRDLQIVEKDLDETLDKGIAIRERQTDW